MQTVFVFFGTSCIIARALLAAPVHNYPATSIHAVAQTSYKDASCGQQMGPCVMQPQFHETPGYRERDTMKPKERASHMTTPVTLNMDISSLQPKSPLLDEVKGHSIQDSKALSGSNQFDQAQLIDQTLYQPMQQAQPQIIIPQWTMHRPARPYKKHSRYGGRHFKIRYYSGNRQ